MIHGIAAPNQVLIDGKEIDLEKSLKFVNHSPDGFSWGYLGSGPSQLAFAILLEMFGEEAAKHFYQDFKRNIILPLPLGQDFVMTTEYVEKWYVKKCRSR